MQSRSTPHCGSRTSHFPSVQLAWGHLRAAKCQNGEWPSEVVYKTPVLGDGSEYTSDSKCGGASASLSVSGCVPSMCVFSCGAVMLPARELGAVVTSVPSWCWDTAPPHSPNTPQAPTLSLPIHACPATGYPGTPCLRILSAGRCIPKPPPRMTQTRLINTQLSTHLGQTQ